MIFEDWPQINVHHSSFSTLACRAARRAMSGFNRGFSVSARLCAVPALAALLLIGLMAVGYAPSALAHPLPRESIASAHPMQATVRMLNQAVKANELFVVNRANAKRGAKTLGKDVPGNMVLGVFAPVFAVRMLEASVEAGFEAPIRIYVTEDPKGKVTVSYVKPTALFAHYKNKKLDAMAKELDALFAKIVAAVK